jgi:very-short-patch-repair endonuclease
LRHNVTKAEKKLWSLLQRAQMCGCSFRRQHPLGNFILDFYSPNIRLAIEVDGGQHNFLVRQTADERRSKWLRAKGITVLRFWNNEVLENSEGVWQEIEHAVTTLKSRRTTPTPTLPLLGGGSIPMEVDR